MYLEGINSPIDLKRLTVEELKILSSEIREFLINNVSNTGGHLGSNLGVVDLTIVLHYLFSSDFFSSIFFDVFLAISVVFLQITNRINENS